MPPTESPAWRWFTTTVAHSATKQHPDVYCSKCLHPLQNAQLGRDILPHALQCEGLGLLVNREATEITRARATNKAHKDAYKRKEPPPPSHSFFSPVKTPRKPTNHDDAPSQERIVGVITESELQGFHLQIARAMYSSFSSFRMIENEEWRKALLYFAPPTTTVPTRHAIATTLLDGVFNTIKEEVLVLLKKASHLTLVTDRWTNPRKAGVFNFVLTSTTTRPIFWTSIEVKGDRHTGVNIAKEVDAVIVDIERAVGVNKISAIGTDNASNMKLSWEVLARKRPYLLAHGCPAHHTNLLLKSMFGLGLLADVLQKAVTVVKFVTNRMVLLYFFKEEQRVLLKRRALCLPVETRWYSHATCVASVSRNRDALEALFRYEDLVNQFRNKRAVMDEILVLIPRAGDDGTATTTEPSERVLGKLETVENIVKDQTFWEDALTVLALTRPVEQAIAAFESDRTGIWSVNHIYDGLLHHPAYKPVRLEMPTLKTLLDNTVKGNVVKLIRERWKRARTTLCDVAYLLDPVLPLAAFPRERELMTLIDEGVEIARKTEIPFDEATFREQFDDFVDAKLSWTDETIASHRKRRDCWTWWGLNPQLRKLAEFARRVLTILASSTASERSWSTQGLVHTKQRSNLTEDRVGKLVFAVSNAGSSKRPVESASSYSLFDVDEDEEEINRFLLDDPAVEPQQSSSSPEVAQMGIPFLLSSPGQ